MDVRNVENFEENGAERVRFEVVVEPEAFDKAVNEQYLKQKKKIQIPGFRRGKVPRRMVENMYGADIFYDEAVSALADGAVRTGLKQAGVRTVGRARLEKYDVGDDKSLIMYFSAARFPRAELGQYRGLEVYRAPIELTDEEFNEELERVRKRNERKVSVEREARMGDTVNVDYTGYIDDEPFEGGSDTNADVILGSGTFIPGFEDQIVGMQIGEERDINVTFPENYQDALAGKDAVFHIVCNGIMESQLPELDDDFAMDVSEFDTLEEYKADLHDQLAAAKEERVKGEFRRQVFVKAMDNMKVDIPPAMLEDELGIAIQEYAREIESQGMSLQEYMNMTGLTNQSLQSMLRPTAEIRAKQDALLSAVAEAEGIELTEEEIAEEYAKAAENYQLPVETVKTMVDEDDLRLDMKRRKAADLIVDSAIPTDKKPEPESKADTDEAGEEKSGEEKDESGAETVSDAEAPAEAEEAAANISDGDTANSDAAAADEAAQEAE